MNELTTLLSKTENINGKEGRLDINIRANDVIAKDWDVDSLSDNSICIGDFIWEDRLFTLRTKNVENKRKFIIDMSEIYELDELDMDSDMSCDEEAFNVRPIKDILFNFKPQTIETLAEKFLDCIYQLIGE